MILVLAGCDAGLVAGPAGSEAASLATPAHWSIGYYPGWVQTTVPPQKVDYRAFTHIFHFGMYPDAHGNVALADMQSAGYPHAAVKAAHAAGKHIVLVIGGEGQGAKFRASTRGNNEKRFVRNIVSTMQTYGYDGVDVDWEESMVESQLVPFIKDLRTALDAVSPARSLHIEVDEGQVPPTTTAKVAAYVSSVNCMCYGDDGADSFAAYVAAGVPAAKLVKGMGFSSGQGYYETTAAHVAATIASVRARGMVGIGGWQIGDLHDGDARLPLLEEYVASGSPSPPPDAGTPPTHGRVYPLHTNINSTTFWVGEIFDPSSPNGSQVFSTYDSKWEAHFGGCDGDNTSGNCTTETRTADNGYFPKHLTPKENPFYLDLPYDDINNAAAFNDRGTVVPWANDPGYAGRAKDGSFSFLKNRWVKLIKGPYVCYGQNEDAGPAGSSDSGYDDELYVFGATDARPKNKLYNSAGLDVSPALNGCLHYSDLNGENDAVSWQFVDDVDVPAGPWNAVVTTSQVTP